VRRRTPPPRAPWGGFPLSELCVFVSLTCAAASLAFWGTARGFWLVAAAGTLGCLAGGEVAYREHFAGYRSHTAPLAGSVAVPLALGLIFAGMPAAVVLLSGGAAFLAAVPLLERAFRRRAGL
jgi:hypothetical protein